VSAIYCDVMIPNTYAAGSAAQVLVYVASNDATAGHTANFQSSDVAVAATSGNLQVGTLTSSSALPYTTTSTAYQQVLLTFAVNSSLAAGEKLIVKIGTAGTGTPPANNMIVYPYLQLSQTF
jgi:ABC-type taurine transport system substrate-binding protein